MSLPEDITVAIPDDPAELEHAWIDDDRKAEAALRRLRRLNDRRGELLAQRDEWANEILDWWAGIAGPLAGQAQSLTEALERYALMTRHRDGRKTVDLPSGTLSTREAADPKVEIVDDKAVLAWADSDAERAERLIKVDRKVLVSDLRKHVLIATTEDGDDYVVDADGELVPGVAVVKPEAKATVSTP